MPRKTVKKTPIKSVKTRRTDTKHLTEAAKLLIASERINTPQNERPSQRTVAKRYGVSCSTVNDIEHNEVIRNKLLHSEHIKKALAADCYILANAGLIQAQNKMSDASAYQAAGIAGLMIDKALNIERGGQAVLVGVAAITSLVDALKGYQSPVIEADYEEIPQADAPNP